MLLIVAKVIFLTNKTMGSDTNTAKPWHDNASGRTYLRADSGKCLHHYFYFIDADLGLCFLWVPT